MPQKVLQPSFSGGVFSPSLYSRVDLTKYLTGLRTAKNFFIHPHGGASNRQGMEFIAAARYADKKSRIVPFEFSLDQAYALEFGNEAIRVFKDGAVVEPQPTIPNFEPTATYNRGDFVKFGYYMVARKNSTGAALFFHSSQDTGLDDLKLLRLRFETGAALAVSLTSGPWDGAPGSYPTLLITFSDTYSQNTAAAIQTKIKALGVDSDGRDFTKFNVTENAAYTANRQYFYAGYPFLSDNGWVYPGGGVYGYNNYPTMTYYRANTTVTGTATNQSIFPAVNWEGQPPNEWAQTTQYEIVTPYLEADLPLLKFTQSADVLYITHPSYAPRMLVRYSETDWRLELYPFKNGPFMSKNVDDSTKLSCNGTAPGWGTGVNIYYVSEYINYAVQERQLILVFADANHGISTGDTIKISNLDGFYAGLSNTEYTAEITPSWMGANSIFICQKGTFTRLNSTAGHTYTPTTGTVAKKTASTLTATLPIFDTSTPSKHIGSLWRLTHKVEGQRITTAFGSAVAGTAIQCGKTWRFTSHGTWSASIQVEKSLDAGTSWQIIRGFSSSSDFNVNTYGDVDAPCLVRARCVAYTSGTANCDLTTDAYEHEGIVKITAVASALSATCDIQTNLGATTATSDWNEGSWSNYRGWPRAVTFFQDRLCFAGTNWEPQTIWMTKTGEYSDFGRSVPLVDSDGISINLPARKMNGIKNLPVLSDLLPMTTATEWSIGAGDGAITPTTVQVNCQGYRGCSDADPLIIGNRILYFQPMGAILRDMGYSLNANGYDSDDLSIMSSHFFDGHSVVEMAFQQEPDSIVWCVRDDGKLLSLTYMREQEVFAWTEHETDGLVESVCTIPGEGYNEVWFVVKRTVNGATVRYIERLAQRMASTLPQDQVFMDSAKTYSGAPATSITGLSHLEGKAVAVLADGNVITGKTVTAGAITLTTPASKVHVGLPYTCDLETLNVEMNLNTGTTQGSKVKIATVLLRFLNSRGGKVGPDAANLDDALLRDPSDVSAVEPLHSQDNEITISSSYEVGGRIFFRQSDPLPTTILAIIPYVQVGG